MKDLTILSIVVIVATAMFLFAIDREIACRDIKNNGYAENCLFDVNCSE